MNEKFDTLKEAAFVSFDFFQHFSTYEVMNENLVIVVESETSLWLVDFCNEKCNHRKRIAAEGEVGGIKKICDDKFAYFWISGICIRNIQGHLLHCLKSNDKYYGSISKLSDSTLIASFRQIDNQRCDKGVQIWNIESGVLMKEMCDFKFVGTCSFGFLIRGCSEKNVLHAYDIHADFIGIIFTDKISPEKIKKSHTIGR